MSSREYLKNSFERFGYPISEKQTDQFLKYADLLVSWNEKMNLTAITDFDEIVWKHFIDSVSFLQSSNVSRETFRGKMMDVGTGAGFPAIPIKILFPNLKVTALDSLNKRITFLEEVKKECALDNITFVHGRAEDFAQNLKYREQYDVCVSRAVANLATLSEYCIPFLKRGGIFLAYKAGDAKEEIKSAEKAIKVFGGELIGAEEFEINGSDLKRTLVLSKKIQNTPKKYPRKAGMPGKSPIYS